MINSLLKRKKKTINSWRNISNFWLLYTWCF